MDKQEKAMQVLENCIDTKIDSIKEYLFDLIQKDTPKEVTDIHCDEYFCPACGAENNCDEYVVCDVFCPLCGQRLMIQDKKEDF